MLKIHHLVASRSDRIVWLAEELEIPYELVRHLRDPQTFRAPESLRAISPLAKAPVIEDQGMVIVESAVICDYLLDQYGQGRLRPSAGTPARLEYAYWMAASEATLMYPALIDVLMTMTQSEAPALLGFAMAEYKTMFDHVDRTLAKHHYIAGDSFTAADVMVYYTIALGAGTAIPMPTHAPMADYPRIRDYLARLEARPALQKALKLCAA